MSEQKNTFKNTPKHPCIDRALRQHRLDTESPMWREHWMYTVRSRGKLIFRGSHAACRIALGAIAADPYVMRNIAGELDTVNR